MKPSTQTSFAEHTGRTLGRVWRGFARLDREACGWLAAQGLPVALAKTLLWVVKLAVFGVLLYAAFWLVLLLVFALVAARGLAQSEQGEDLWAPKDELRHGEAGYGLYSSSGQRIDPHDPNNPYDE
jgi:hypothetical protein